VIETFSTLNPEVEIELLTGAYVLGLAQREADVSFRIHPSPRTISSNGD
jgi:DNA-binding transcriptional LysR family regulator